MSRPRKSLKALLMSALRVLAVLGWGLGGLLYLGHLWGLITGTSTMEFPWNILVALLGPVLLFFSAFLLIFLGIGE